MKHFATILLVLLMCMVLTDGFAQQPADGENSYRFTTVNRRFLTPPDTISCTSGRGVYVAAEPDLDNDGLPEILITEYRDGGRILVFEVVGDNTLEYVWGSKRLNPGGFGGLSTPRSVSVGDFDNNGRLEIHFQVGHSATDSLQKAQRGFYIYEFTGNDNDYGTEPARQIRFEEIDSVYATINFGRNENGLICEDIDGDSKNELLFLGYNSGVLEGGNMSVLEVESGTFAAGDANVRVEYKYTTMAKALEFETDGYVPVRAAVGDIDNDGNNEIAILGWTNINAGAGIGFLEVSAVDTYTPGNIVPLSDVSIFAVKGGLAILDVGGEKAVMVGGGSGTGGDRKIWVADNIVSEAFIGPSSFNVISENALVFGIFAVGDQDHGTTGADGFDIYYSTGSEIRDLEYNGTGALSDAASYTSHGRLGAFNLDEAYDFSDGLFNSVYTYSGMDLDKDGNRDIVVGHKGACGDAGDVLEGAPFRINTFGIFVFEWGDSTQSIPLTLNTAVEAPASNWNVIMPDDYVLDQNYPNPFNPETNISFTLPLDKQISLIIYDSMGREVRTLISNELLPQGTHKVKWDATNNAGEPVTSGVYVYKLVYGNFVKSKTMTLMR